MTPKIGIGIGIVAALGLSVTLYFHFHRAVSVADRPMILGHGGSGIRSFYPMNSIGSIQNALSYPIDGLELDVRMTEDCVLVAFHDSILDDATNCNGSIERAEWKELIDCQYNSYFKSEKIATLSQLLDLCKRGTTVSVDIKPSERKTLLAQKLIELIHQHHRIHFIFESKDMEQLLALRRFSTEVELFLISNDHSSGQKLAIQNELNGISLHMSAINQEAIQQAQQKGLSVMLWGTGSTRDNRKAVELNPDIIQTDDIGSMVGILTLE